MITNRFLINIQMLYKGDIQLRELLKGTIRLPKKIKCGKSLTMNVKSSQGDENINFIIKHIGKDGIHCMATKLDIICIFKKLDKYLKIDYTITVSITINNIVHKQTITGNTFFTEEKVCI